MAFSRVTLLCGLVFALAAVHVVLADTDYYAVLGLRKGANEQEIKRAYRKLSLQFHPDKNPGNKEAEKRMQEITNAHDILGDPEKKKIYDQHGEEGLKQHQANGGRQQNPFDIFSMFGFGGGAQNQEARTPDVTLPLHVTLKDLYLGRVTEVHYVRHVLCERHADCTTTSGCGDCSGPGQRVVTRQLGPGFVQRMEQADPKCISQVSRSVSTILYNAHARHRASVGRTTASTANPSLAPKR
jgi:DnaJ-related protein SCJ1